MKARGNWSALIIVWVLATVALSIAAAGDNILPGDLAIARRVQGVDFPAVKRVERAGYHLGTYGGVLVVAAPVVAVLALTRRYAGAFMIAAALVLRSVNPLVKELIESPRPTADLVRVLPSATGDPGSYGFPSGHTMGATLVFGSMIYVAQRTIRPRRLRLCVQIPAALAIAVVGWSRIYSGAHWPSDVLGGLLWGTTFLLLILGLHRRWRARRSGLAAPR